MTKTKKDLGLDMIEQGELSEFHQQKAKQWSNTPHMQNYHLDMYDYHHREYIRLQKVYLETPG